MRSKVTVVLLFLNVVLFYYIFYHDLPALNERKTLETRQRVLGPEVASIDSLTRTSPGAAPVKLERRGDAWWLTEPYEWPADRNAVTSLLNELQFLEHETSFAVADLAQSGQTLADFGLETPALTLTFESGGRSYPLKIGDDTRIGNRLYVLSPDGTRIHVVGRSLAETVGRNLADLRSTSIFTIPVFEVRSLNVQTSPPTNLKVRLRRDTAARWVFEAPIRARANKSAVEVTINALNSLVAKNFVQARDTDLERMGLNSPALQVTLEGNTRRETLLLGQAAPEGGYYARIEDKTVIFTTAAPQPLIDVLNRAQDELRDPRVLDFDPGTVTGLTITAPAQPEISLQKLEAATTATTASLSEGWQAVTRVSGQVPLTTTADPTLIADLLQKLYLLSARKFVSDAPLASDLENYGFNRPEREITLNLSSGGGPRATDPFTQTLQIGISPDRPGIAYARTTDAPFVYEILPDILDETPAAALYYRRRLLRELPAGARITSLQFAELVSPKAVFNLRSDTALTPETIAATDLSPNVRQGVVALLGQLRVLRAKRFTANTFTLSGADTPQGPRPWKYRLEIGIAFAGGNTDTPNTTSTLYLTDRLGGTTLLAGTDEFGGVVFEVTQEMLDALFALAYTEQNDPGPAEPPADAASPVNTPPEPSPASGA